MVEEVRPQHLWDGQHPLGVPDGLEDLVGQQRGRRSRALRSARRAQITGLAREGQQILLGTVGAAHPGEPVLEQAAVQVAPNLLVDEPTPVPILPLESLLPLRLNLVEMGLEEAVQGCGPRRSRPVQAPGRATLCRQGRALSAAWTGSSSVADARSRVNADQVRSR